MADSVVRRDIIQIEWDVGRNPLPEISQDTDKLKQKLGGMGTEGSKSIKQLTDGFNKLSSKMDKVSSKMTKGIVAGAKMAAKAIAGIGVASIGAATIGVNFNAQMETYSTSFEVMTGSASKAAEIVTRLNKMGAETPFEMTDLADTTQLLMNYGLSADDAISRMSMLGDIAQGSAEKMNRIAMAYGQMSSAGKVQLGDVKQMIEAGFNPLQEISQTTGESMSSLYDRISKGTISVDEITASMQRSTSAGGKYFQSMEKQSKTFNGQLSTMQDNLNMLLGSMTSGLSEKLAGTIMPQINGFMENLTDAFNQGGLSGLLGQLGPLGTAIQGVVDKFKALTSNKEKMALLSGIFNTIKTTVSLVVTTVGELVQKFVDFATSTGFLTTFQTVLNGVNSALQFVKTHMSGIITAFLAAYAAVTTLSVGLKIASALTTAYGFAQTFMANAQKMSASAALKATMAQYGFNTAMLTSPVTWIVVGIAALVAIIIVLARNWDKVKEVAVNCWNAIKTAFGTAASWLNTNVVQPIVNWFKVMWMKIKAGFAAVVVFFQGAWNSVKAVFSTVVNWLVTNIVTPIKTFVMNLCYFIIGIAAYVWQGISTLWGIIAGWVNTTIIQPIVRGFMWLWTGITNAVRSVWNSICSIWGVISSWVMTNVINPLKIFFTNLWNSIVNGVNRVKSWFVAVWGAISGWVNACVVTPVKTAFTNCVTAVTNGITKVKNWFVSIWGTISGWVNTNVISPTKEFFSGLWSSITTKVGEVKETITSSFQDAWDSVTSLWNGITDFFSGLWDGIKNIVGKIISKGKEAVGASDDAKSGARPHAIGGLMTKPHVGLVAEAGPEMIIPLSSGMRGRGIELWQQAGQMLGANTAVVPRISLPQYSPGDSATRTSSSYSESNTYSPQFNLTMNGTTDRTTERTIKRWVQEALAETFDSIGRTSGRLQEV